MLEWRVDVPYLLILATLCYLVENRKVENPPCLQMSL
jgi:hypothetical protein